MRLELAERLVCPAPHARTPLIVVAEETRERDLVRGTAGCMLCHREGTFSDGSLRFDREARARGLASPDASAAGAVDDASLLRLAALLGLGEARLPVLLAASFAAFAEPLVAQYDALVAVFGVDGPSPSGVGNVSGCGDALPFADGSFHAAALDGAMTAAVMADAVRCVRTGGRVMAAVSLPLPPGVRELARDERYWVSEVLAPAIVVPLRRA